MAYAVQVLNVFDKEMNKLSESDKEIIQKIFLQLKENPYVGDQIRYKFFREKRKMDQSGSEVVFTRSKAYSMEA